MNFQAHAHRALFNITWQRSNDKWAHEIETSEAGRLVLYRVSDLCLGGLRVEKSAVHRSLGTESWSPTAYGRTEVWLVRRANPRLVINSASQRAYVRVGTHVAITSHPLTPQSWVKMRKSLCWIWAVVRARPRPLPRPSNRPPTRNLPFQVKNRPIAN